MAWRNPSPHVERGQRDSDGAHPAGEQAVQARHGRILACARGLIVPVASAATPAVIVVVPAAAAASAATAAVIVVVPAAAAIVVIVPGRRRSNGRLRCGGGGWGRLRVSSRPSAMICPGAHGTRGGRRRWGKRRNRSRDAEGARPGGARSFLRPLNRRRQRSPNDHRLRGRLQHEAWRSRLFRNHDLAGERNQARQCGTESQPDQCLRHSRPHAFPLFRRQGSYDSSAALLPGFRAVG